MRHCLLCLSENCTGNEKRAIKELFILFDFQDFLLSRKLIQGVGLVGLTEREGGKRGSGKLLLPFNWCFHLVVQNSWVMWHGRRRRLKTLEWLSEIWRIACDCCKTTDAASIVSSKHRFPILFYEESLGELRPPFIRPPYIHLPFTEHETLRGCPKPVSVL